MVGTYRALLLLLLFAALTCGTAAVSAQNGGDKVLVAGERQLRQSDVDAMVEFYEWAFDAKFSGGQREQFQALTAADFRKDPAAARKGIDELLDMNAKVKALDEGRRREVRGKFTADFVEHLRQTPEDESAQLLLGIYEGAGGGAGQAQTAGAEGVERGAA